MNAYTVAFYDVVTFLWCNNYHEHPIDFPSFLRNTLIPAQQSNPDLRVMNDPRVILWNMDKHYLVDLAEAGFRIPRTTFFDLRRYTMPPLLAEIRSLSGSQPQVLKPAISGSAKMTHLLRDPKFLSRKDLKFLQTALEQGMDGNLIVQEYQKNIVGGEYSLIFVNGEHSHTILKTPQAGEFRCQGEFGGSVAEIGKVDVPKNALETAHGIMSYMTKKFPPRMTGNGKSQERIVYARIDGIMKGDEFLLMEVEAIEPHLWLETDAGAHSMDELCNALLLSS